jgi:hypothetical protein
MTTASGARWDRPELNYLLDQLREGDTVVVWKLDRSSCARKGMVQTMERIADADPGFSSITQNIDTTIPAGGRSSMQPSASRSPKASPPAANQRPTWRGFTASTSLRCHVSSPRTPPDRRSVQF